MAQVVDWRQIALQGMPASNPGYQQLQGQMAGQMRSMGPRPSPYLGNPAYGGQSDSSGGMWSGPATANVGGGDQMDRIRQILGGVTSPNVGNAQPMPMPISGTMYPGGTPNFNEAGGPAQIGGMGPRYAQPMGQTPGMNLGGGQWPQWGGGQSAGNGWGGSTFAQMLQRARPI